MNSHRPALLVSLATALAVVAALLTPVAAHAATHGSVSGVVSLATGAPAKDATVQLLELSYADGLPLPADAALKAKTTATGAFSFASVPTGYYTLEVSGVAGYFTQFLGGSVTIAGSKPFIVATAKASYHRVSLEASASLAVSVKSLAGKAVKGASVAAYSRNDFGDWVQRATGTTSAAGAFTFTSLNPDDYRVRAWSTTGAIPSVYSGNSATLSAADSIAVNAGIPVRFDFAVPTTGVITGALAGSHDGITVPKLAGVTVRLLRIAGALGDPSTTVEATDYLTVSSATGAYSFAAITPGTYTLRYTPPRLKNGVRIDPAYGETYLGGTNTAANATRITVTAGATAAVPTTTLLEGGTLTGHVLWFGSPQANVPVYIYNAQFAPPLALLPGMESTRTDANGVYTVNGLGAGDWNVRVGSGAERVRSAAGYNDVFVPAFFQMTVADGEVVEVFDVTVDFATGAEQPTLESPPTITGDSQVEHELTAHPAVFSGGSVAGGGTYIWLRDGVAIPGAIGQYYVPTGMDAGRRISVRQTYYFTNRFARTTTSSETATIWEGSAPDQSVAMSISGPLKVDSTVVANPGTWNLAGLSYTYNWCDYTGSPVLCTVLGSGKTFTPTGAMVGKPIALEVTTHRYGYGSTRAMLGFGTVATTTFTQLTAPKVTKAGSVLTLSPGTWSSPVTSVQPTWQYFDVPSEAWVTAGTSLSLNAAPLVGKRIRVVAQIFGAGVASHTFAVHAQTGVASAPTGYTTLQPTYTVPTTAYAPSATFPSDPDGDETTLSYQWQVKKGTKWVPIAGATAGLLPIDFSLVGKNIRVVVKVRSAGFTDTSFTTPQALVLPHFEPSLGASVVVYGTVAVGSTLTNSTPLNWDVSGVKTSYSWEYYSGGWKKIPGATKNTYKVAEAYYGLTIAAIITGTKSGYAPSVNEVSLGTVGKGNLTVTTAGSIKKSGAKWVATAPVMAQGATTKNYQWSYYDETTDIVWNLGSGPTLTSIPVSETGGHTPQVEVVHKRTGYNDTLTSTWGSYLAGLSVTTAGSIQLPDGDVRVGHALNATPGIFALPATSRSYQWFEGTGSKFTAIAGATTSSFTPTPAQLGKTVRVTVTGYRTGLKPASFTASTATTVQRGTAPALVSSPGITGTPIVGNQLVGHVGSWVGTGYTYTYAWLRGSGTTPIATTSTYTPIGLDAGQTLTLRVGAIKTGYAPAFATATTFAVSQTDLVVRSAPVVATSGSKVRVSAGTWSTSAVAIEVTWHVFDRASGVATNIPGAVGQWFSTSPYPGQKITVTVEASAIGYFSGSKDVTAKLGRAATWVGSGAPTTTAETFGGAMLGLNSNWDLVANTTRYTWKRNGKVIADADTTSHTYAFTDADAGAVISVTVLKITAGYAPGEKTFTMTGKVARAIPAPSGLPSLGDVASVGTKITATPGTWATPGLSYSYAWYYLDGGVQVAIPGASTASLTPTPELAGRMLFVRVTATRANYLAQSSLSDTVQVNPGAAATASSAASIAIVLTTPDTLTAGLGTVTPGFTVTVQWFHNGVALWGETGSTYTHTADGPGTVHAVFTATRPGFVTTTFVTPDVVVP
jgi:hypothetical protein